MIHELQAAKRELLQATIQEIHAHITQRNQLTQHLLEDIEEELLDKESQLLNAKPNHLSWCLIDTERVSELEQTISRLKQQGRTVRTQHWQDIADLQKELRNLHLELTLLDRKQALLDGLLHNAAYSPQDNPGAAEKAQSDPWQGH